MNTLTQSPSNQVQTFSHPLDELKLALMVAEVTQPQRKAMDKLIEASETVRESALQEVLQDISEELLDNLVDYRMDLEREIEDRLWVNTEDEEDKMNQLNAIISLCVL